MVARTPQPTGPLGDTMSIDKSYTFEFALTISGSGPDANSAWRDAHDFDLWGPPPEVSKLLGADIEFECECGWNNYLLLEDNLSPEEIETTLESLIAEYAHCPVCGLPLNEDDNADDWNTL